MDQPAVQPPPAPPPKSNPIPLVLVVGGAAGCLGLLILCTLAAWIFWPSSESKPAAVVTTASTSTVRAEQESVVGAPESAQVIVPAGAVEKDVDLSIAPQSKEPRSSPGVRVVGNVWSLKVDGRSRYKFKKPVRVALPIDRALVRSGTGTSLAWWGSRRWEKVAGSRVEGDRVVGDVDHFTEFAAVEEDPETAPKPTWTDVSSWTGQVDLTTTGSWSQSTPVSSSQWAISRQGFASFRVSSPYVRGSVGRWAIPSKPSAEEGGTIHVGIADGGYDTDNDHDKSGNCFYHKSWTGGGSTSRVSASLEIDVAAGTYRVSVSGQPIGKVVGTSRSTPFGGDPPDTQEPASFSFQSGPFPLPAAIGPITGSVSDTPEKINGNIGGSDVDTIPAPKKSIITEVRWSLTPGPPGLQARIRGPLIVRRGEGITLDGSASTGEVSEYRWTFEVGAGGPKGPNHETELRTPSVTFTALWDFKAILEVKDKSGKTDTAVRHIQVLPRKGYDWETRFPNTRPPKPPIPLSSALMVGTNGSATMLHLGINLCAKDGDVDYSGHVIHRKPTRPQDVDKPTWLDVGYEVISVNRGDGPFGGVWYVLKASLEVERTERVNMNLMPGGTVYTLNEEKRNLQAILNLLQQVRDHEYWHTQLVKEEFEKVRKEKADPAIMVEKTFGLGKTDLVKEADRLIMDIDSRLGSVLNDEEKVKKKLGDSRLYPVYQQSVSIWFHNDQGGSVPRPLGKLSDIGDDYKDNGK